MATTTIKLSIKNRWTGKILFEDEKEKNTIKDTLEAAIAARANLTDANLTRADLTGADLTSIKNDLFIVLLHAIPEVKFLRQNIIDGKIDGSTYEGECACLSGTLENGAKISNGILQEPVIKNIMKCRNSNRPIERFFLAINKGDTPETNQFSKLALEWVDEFIYLINIKPVA